MSSISRSPGLWLTAVATTAALLGVSLLSDSAAGLDLTAWLPNVYMPVFLTIDVAFRATNALYHLILAVALFRLIIYGTEPGRQQAIEWVVFQFGLTIAWSLSLFSLRGPFYGLVVIVLVLLALLASLPSITRADPVAARLMTPYAIWVMFVALLTASIFVLHS